MIRDKEIERLISYAEGLGVKVKFSSTITDAAEWVTDGSEIIISNKNNISKTDIILSLIHEIGHQCWYIHEKNRKPDLKFEEALERQNLFDNDSTKTPAPKSLRYKILKAELESSSYWEIIYKDTDLKIPLWKVRATREFDMWQYNHYYITGHFPTNKQKKSKHADIILRFKNK